MADTTRKFLDPVRNVDMEFVSRLEVLEREIHPLPGSFVRREGVDPRLAGLKVMMTAGGAVGPREGDQICLYESLAMIRHTPTGHVYLAFRETMDELMAQQTDPVKYPMWVMDSAGKRAERKILIARVLHRPTGKDDREWLEFPPDTPAGDRVFDSIAYFLLRRQVISEEMYGRS
jgi:hypothetical protein